MIACPTVFLVSTLAQGSVNPSNIPAVPGVGRVSVSSLSSSPSDEVRLDCLNLDPILGILLFLSIGGETGDEGLGIAECGREVRRGWRAISSGEMSGNSESRLVTVCPEDELASPSDMTDSLLLYNAGVVVV